MLLNQRSITIVPLFLIIAFFTFITACDNNSTDSNTAALTELDFAKNPDLFADPDKGVVVVFLEPAGASEEDNLTGQIGFDVVPYKYKNPINNTFCFEDSNIDSDHYMTMIDSNDQEVLKVEANGDCVTELIETGTYKMVLTHGESNDRIDTIFIEPQESDDVFAQKFKNDGILNKLNRFTSGLLSNLDLANSSHAQSDSDTIVITNNSCISCNLLLADLSGQNLENVNLSDACLSFANLSGADLSGANLSSTELMNANISSANVTNANMSNALAVEANFSDSTMNSVNLSGSDSTDAVYNMADLTDSTVTNANFQGTKFLDAILTGLDLTGLNVSGADFTGATYTDGACVCSDASCSNCM